MTIEQALESFNGRLNSEALDSPDFKAANASGRFAAFMRSDSSFRIVSEGDQVVYTKTTLGYRTAIDKGTPPGRRVGITKAIYNWLEFRKYGLDWKGEAERKRLSWLIAAKHERFGSYKHRNPQAQTRIFEQAIERAKPSLFEMLNKAAVQAQNVKIKDAADFND